MVDPTWHNPAEFLKRVSPTCPKFITRVICLGTPSIAHCRGYFSFLKPPKPSVTSSRHNTKHVPGLTLGNPSVKIAGNVQCGYEIPGMLKIIPGTL
jgi:hypothetical protein